MTKHIFLDGPELQPAYFPHADSERLEDAPARCPRCGTGLWREVSDGLQCRACPRRWLVQEKLRELVGRTLETEASGHRINAPKGKAGR
jgi:DNA-directed RNA polymerase subunit RPC12/RpoP